jgi:hypothetical protein
MENWNSKLTTKALKKENTKINKNFVLFLFRVFVVNISPGYVFNVNVYCLSGS